MPFLLFISTQITYKRFLLLWAVVGLLLTDSSLALRYYSPFWDILYFFASLAVVCFMFSLLINNSSFRFQLSTFEVLMILYLVAVALSCIINHSIDSTFQILQVAIPVEFGLLYIYAFTRKDFKSIILGLAIFGLINIPISYFVFIADKLGVDTPFPVSGIFNDRNGFVRYLSIINSYFLIEFLLQKNKIRRLFYAFLIGAIFFGILVQYSRSGYIVYFISSTVIIFFCGSSTAKKNALLILPIVLILFAYFIVIRIHMEKMNLLDTTDLGRIYTLKSGINMIKAHPIKGVGYGMSRLLIKKYADKYVPNLGGSTPIHNWFVAVWAEMGLLGIIVFCILNYSLMHISLKKCLQSGLLERKYSLFVFTSLLILMIDALFLPNYDNENIYWIIVAMGVINLKEAKVSLNAGIAYRNIEGGLKNNTSI